ncbi:MAG: hypothetical protein JOZ37_15005 [Actinobacteria bacterium]|nr:hypothetical protein [Actinomycetota bacterium]
MLTGRHPARALALAMVLAAGWVATGPARAAPLPAAAPTLDFVNAFGNADGIQTTLELDNALPIQRVVDLTTVSAEARLSLAQSTALAALPDPGDTVISLPGTVGGLTGTSGLPSYPAAVRADYPLTPRQAVVVGSADSGVTAGLEADATANRAAAEARVGHVAGTAAPATIGQVRTSVESKTTGPGRFAVTATSETSDIELLDGQATIANVRSLTELTLEDGIARVVNRRVDVSGAYVLGTPVAITDEGVVAPGGAHALDPVVAQAAAPLAAQGVSVHLTTSNQDVHGSRATAVGGGLEIDTPVMVGNFPGRLQMVIGRTSGTIDAGSHDTPAGDDALAAAGSDSGVEGATVSAGTDTSSSIPDRTVAPVAAAPKSLRVAPATTAATLADLLDFRSLYRWMVACAVGLLIARRWAPRLVGGRREGRDLRKLWRW